MPLDEEDGLPVEFSPGFLNEIGDSIKACKDLDGNIGKKDIISLLETTHENLFHTQISRDYNDMFIDSYSHHMKRLANDPMDGKDKESLAISEAAYFTILEMNRKRAKEEMKESGIGKFVKKSSRTSLEDIAGESVKNRKIRDFLIDIYLGLFKNEGRDYTLEDPDGNDYMDYMTGQWEFYFKTRGYSDYDAKVAALVDTARKMRRDKDIQSGEEYREGGKKEDGHKKE